jgi:hypothetical protein
MHVSGSAVCDGRQVRKALIRQQDPKELEYLYTQIRKNERELSYTNREHEKELFANKIHHGKEIEDLSTQLMGRARVSIAPIEETVPKMFLWMLPLRL